MRRFAIAVALASITLGPARVSAAQKAPQPTAPTKTAAPLTPEETAGLRAGIALEQQGKFDEAIAQFKPLLEKNPDLAMAMYETALCYQAKKEYDKAIEMAVQAADYSGESLALSLSLVGTILDQRGQPKEAVEYYAGAAALVTDPATIYYNQAITYLNSLHQPVEGREALKRAARANPKHPSTQLVLARVFQSGGYTTPAFFALSRFLILEPGTNRTGPALNTWFQILRGPVSARPDGGMQVALDPKAKTDEGDFAKFTLYFAMSSITNSVEGGNGGTEVEALVAQVDRLFAMIPGDEGVSDPKTFTGTFYAPYFSELKQKNFVAPFVYFLCQRTNLTGVRDWLNANRTRVQEFLAWNAAYPWPK
jgi:tetratricopeptide (TPR) repeat protein